MRFGGREVPLQRCPLSPSSCRAAALTGAFDTEEITHVEGDVNPIRDLEIIHEELRYGSPTGPQPLDALTLCSPSARTTTGCAHCRLKDEEFLLKKKAELERKGVSRGANKELKPEYVRGPEPRAGRRAGRGS